MHELWRLELSDGQREQLETLAASHRGEMEAHAPRAESLHAALETLWSAAELDGEAILARTAELSELHKQMDQTRARHRIAVLSLLTAEQRSELARRIEERRESFDRRDGPPMMRGPRPERGPRGARRPF